MPRAFDITVLLPCLLALAPACVVTDDDDDDSHTTSAADETGDPTSRGDSAGDGQADVTPRAGRWQYREVAGATNDCSFIAQPSNGFGEFGITALGGAAFDITPGDATDPFVCTAAGGSFGCDERLTGTIDDVPGYDVVGNILVSIEGTVESSTAIAGTQIGHIDCVGDDCAAAAAALGVAFPCDFTVPFEATAL